MVKYDECKWKVSYGLPAHGKDLWSRKAEERDRLERETGKRTRRRDRFSWRRSKRKSKASDDAAGPDGE